MNRTKWLENRRMQKFRDVLSRWTKKRLSGLDAAESLGMSERSFRRYRRRYEEESEAGLLDKRLGNLPARRVPTDKREWMLDLYRTRYMGWTESIFTNTCRSATTTN